MELEQIINDTRELSGRLHAPELLGAWEPCALIADLAGEVGTLAQSVLTVEGIAAAPPENAHVQLDLTRILFQLINLSNVYGIDLARAWDNLIQEGWANAAKLANQSTTNDA